MAVGESRRRDKIMDSGGYALLVMGEASEGEAI